MKGLWSFVVIFGILGLVLMGTGYIMGADTSIYFDRGGLRTDSGEYTHKQVSETGKITEISIDVASADVNLIPWDSYGFEIYSKDSSDFTYLHENGKLVIEQNVTLGINIGFSFTGNEYINIYYPAANTKMRDVEIRSTSGRVNIDSLRCDTLEVKQSSGKADIKNITATDVTVSNTSGSVDLDNIKGRNLSIKMSSGKMSLKDIDASADVTVKNTSGSTIIDNIHCRSFNSQASSGKIDIKDIDAKSVEMQNTSGKVTLNGGKATSFAFTLSSGSLTAENLTSSGLTAKMTSGSAKLSGSLKGINKIDTSSGRMDISIEGSERDYNRNISTSSGNVYINGTKNNNRVSGGNAKNSLDIRSSSGNVYVTFAE